MYIKIIFMIVMVLALYKFSTLKPQPIKEEFFKIGNPENKIEIIYIP